MNKEGVVLKQIKVTRAEHRTLEDLARINKVHFHEIAVIAVKYFLCRSGKNTFFLASKSSSVSTPFWLTPELEAKVHRLAQEEDIPDHRIIYTSLRLLIQKQPRFSAIQ